MKTTFAQCLFPLKLANSAGSFVHLTHSTSIVITIIIIDNHQVETWETDGTRDRKFSLISTSDFLSLELSLLNQYFALKP